jgi:hypothetical protein
MSAALHTQATLMLRAPWQWGSNDGRVWAMRLCTGLAALAVGVPTVTLIFRMVEGWLAVLMGVIGAVALVALWAVQFSALLHLDHPHSARFVVGYGRSLRAAALGLWLGLVAFVGVVTVLALHPMGGGAGSLLLLVVMAAGATFLYVAMALRWWLLWLVIWLPFPLMAQPGARAILQPVLNFFKDHWQAEPVWGTVLAILAMGAALVNLFGRADAAHAQAYTSRERFRKIASAGATGQKPTLAAYGHWGEVLSSPFQRLADAWLARVTRRACHRTASVMDRAEVVLFGTQHWVRHVGGIVAVQLVVIIGWFVLMRSVGTGFHERSLDSSKLGMSIGLASMVIAPLASLPGSLWGSRREQALLVLLPGMPQGAALNRAVARQQMRHFLWACAAGLPAFAAMAWWGDLPQVWAFFFAAWPLSAMLWRDASRLRAPSLWVGWAYGLFVVLGVLSMLLMRWKPALLGPWVLGMVLLTVALLAWRWRKLSHWPQALPAGRLA